MRTINEVDLTELIAAGNGARVVVPDSGDGFLRLSYLWGKLRVDRCDLDGKIILPERRGGGDVITPPSVP